MRPAPWSIVEEGIAAAAGRCIVIVEQHSRMDLRFAASTLTTNGVAGSTTTTVIAIDDRESGSAVGVVSGAVRSGEQIVELVKLAELRARTGPQATDGGDLPAAQVDDSFTHPPTPPATNLLEGVAADLGREFASVREPHVEWFGYVEHTVSSTWLGTSEGALRVHHHPAGRVEATGKSDNRAHSVWHGVATQNFEDVSVEAIAAELRKRLSWGARSSTAAPGRQPVILPAGAVVDLLIPMMWGASARDAREGRSAFAGPDGTSRLGQTLARSTLTVSSDPYQLGAPTRPFVCTAVSGSTTSVFDNGLSLGPTAWIGNGVLQHLVGPRSEAVHSSGVAPHIDNLVIQDSAGYGSLDDLVARTEDALLITCLWYIREVDPQTMLNTGLTRDGVYRVRDGEVVGSVGNFRFNASPLDVLDRIVDATEAEVAQPREWADDADATVAPALLVDAFNLSTRSDAL